MKKILTAAVALLLCVMIALPVGAGVTAVSSPALEATEIKKATLNGMALEDCVVITTVQQAEDKATDITQEERDALLAAYNALVDGSASLPIEGEYAVREIVDISFKKSDCRDREDHGKKDEVLKQEGVTLVVDLNMGIEAGAKLCVMTYIGGEWKEIVSTVNNGDGTVTCEFEDLCPVAIAVLG